MTGDSDFRRRRILFRCRHDSAQEIDLIFAPFAEISLAGFDSALRNPLVDEPR